MTPALDASSLVKRFGAVTALSDGRLRVEPGEIHALLGSNGCGKSTLCKIVAGAVAPDSGVLRVAGQDVRMRHPRDAEALGVALFFQELSLVGQLTVAENLCLGREPVRPGGFTDRRAMRAQALALAAQFGPGVAARLQPDTPVAALPPDLRQVVEVLKVLARRPRLMILDEATAALDAEQARTLFAILRARKAEGVSTIMISHRLDEVFAVADRITVMRNGVTVAELDRAAATPDEVVRHMVGGEGPPARQDTPAGHAPAGPPLLEGEGLSGRGLRGVSFSLAPGEVVGLGGLQGQGQSALLQGLFGALPLAGQVRLAGAPLRLARPADAIRAGLAYVSGDRGRDAGLHGRSIFENLVAARLVRDGRWAVFPRALAPEAAASAAALRTKYGRLADAIGTLSGGNQQKVFIARWLATNPRMLLLDDPTKGIDLGAKADLFALVRGLADAGAGVLLHSSDDAELLGQCSRILVFNGGRVSAELAGDRRDAFHLTRAAYGEAA